MAQLVERLLSGPEALGLVPSTELGLTQTHNPNTRGHSWLPREFKASLPVTTPHKQINTQTNKPTTMPPDGFGQRLSGNVP